jgi:hypothetical protein
VFLARHWATWKDGNRLGRGWGCRVGGQTSPNEIAVAGLVCVQLCVGVHCCSIAQFSAPLLNTRVTYKVCCIHCTHSAMNFSHTVAFSLQKMDHCVNLTLGGNFLWCGDTETRVTLWQVPQLRGWLCREVAYICS